MERINHGLGRPGEGEIPKQWKSGAGAGGYRILGSEVTQGIESLVMGSTNMSTCQHTKTEARELTKPYTSVVDIYILWTIYSDSSVLSAVLVGEAWSCFGIWCLLAWVHRWRCIFGTVLRCVCQQAYRTPTLVPFKLFWSRILNGRG